MGPRWTLLGIILLMVSQFDAKPNLCPARPFCLLFPQGNLSDRTEEEMINNCDRAHRWRNRYHEGTVGSCESIP